MPGESIATYSFPMRTTALGLLLLISLHAQAEAQAPDRAGAAASRRWEVEWYGGLSLANPPSSGTTRLPPPGAPLTTSSPLFPSRQIPSWFFGDGAALLNDVNAAFGLASRLSPLDAAFDSPDFELGSRATFGIRIRRGVSRRVSVELSVDSFSGSGDAPAGLVAAAEAARETFESALGALLSSGPFPEVTLGATRATTEGSNRDLYATAALNLHFRPDTSLVPYLTAGGGVAAATGTFPSVVLEGRYRFSILGLAAIEETDRVTIRADRDTTFVAVAGAGVRRLMSRRWGFRVDGRVFVGPGGRRLLVDTAATVASATPAAYIESFTHPSVQFSNHQSTGRQSTLSAPPIQGFSVFESDGFGTRTAVTVGLFARF
jgi:hypothetical protein